MSGCSTILPTMFVMGIVACAEHIRATVRSETCAFVRLSENGNVDVHNSAALVKRALDIGADGVLIPCVETAEQCRILVSQARYPYHEPAGGIRGIRGIGGERATVWGRNFIDHVQEAAAEPPFVVPLLETHNAFLNRHAIAKVVGAHPLPVARSCDSYSTERT